VHSSADSLIYKIPLISDDYVNLSPQRDTQLEDQIKNEDFVAFDITTRLDTIFSDPNGDILTYNIVSSTRAWGNISINSALFTLSYGVIADSNGIDTVIVSASDGEFTVYDTLEINVRPVNDAPLYTSGGDLSVNEETNYSSTWATAMSVGPVNEVGQNLNFNIISVSRSGLFSAQPQLSNAGELSFVGAKDSVGEAIIYFELRDDGGVLNGGVDSTLLDSLIVELINVNDTPVIKDSISDLIVVEDSGLVSIERFDSLFIDLDGDVLTYEILLSNGKALDSSSLDSIRLFTANDSNGVVEVTVTATDPSGLSVTTQFNLEITPANDAPTGITLSSDSIIENKETGYLIGNLGTIDIDIGDVFQYELIESLIYTSNDFVQINGNRLEVRLSDSIDYETRTSFQIKMRSYDSDSAFVDSVFTIFVKNTDEILTQLYEINDIFLDEDFDDTLVISGLDTIFIDPDEDLITFTIQVLKNKVVESISTDSITFQSILNENGIDTLIISAQDISGNQLKDTVLVTIRPIDDEIIVNDTVGTVKENVNDSSVVAVIVVIDVDDDSITYVLDPQDSNYVIDDEGNIYLRDGVTLDYEVSPFDTLTVTVSDGTGEKTISVIITIQNEIEASEVIVTQIENEKKP
jgi:hypothetical protein